MTTELTRPSSELNRVLVEARRLLSQGWCQGSYARDERGESVPVGDSAAARFCLSGACPRAARNVRGDSSLPAFAVVRILLSYLGGDWISAPSEKRYPHPLSGVISSAYTTSPAGTTSPPGPYRKSSSSSTRPSRSPRDHLF